MDETVVQLVQAGVAGVAVIFGFLAYWLLKGLQDQVTVPKAKYVGVYCFMGFAIVLLLFAAAFPASSSSAPSPLKLTAELDRLNTAIPALSDALEKVQSCRKYASTAEGHGLSGDTQRCAQFANESAGFCDTGASGVNLAIRELQGILDALRAKTATPDTAS